MKARCLLVLLLSIYSTCLGAKAAQDPRYVLISQQQLVQKIRQTPLSSNEHLILIRRAASSGLSDVSFSEYSSRWQKSQDDAKTNLLRGLAAQRAMEANVRSPKQFSTNKSTYLGDIARSSLLRAYARGKADPVTALSYGYYLWYWDHQEVRGLNLMLEAEKMAPNNSSVQSTLGSVYAESTRNVYNPQKAIEYSRTAIRLDPLFSNPHWTLARLYTYKLKQFQLAQKELNVFKNLLPPHIVGDPTIVSMQSYIAKGLKQRSG